jgi:ribosome-associated toxin RatA of RatAB toxin-antitoxin module
MSDKIHAQASHIIDARPEQVYAVIRDYQVGHPAILPKYFTGLRVVKGGQGEGTELFVDMKVYGQDFHYHQVVTEPEPGRTLVETDVETGQFSRFTFEPLNGGKQTKVTIFSEFPASPGLKGWVEKLMQPSIAARMYKEELHILNTYVRGQANRAN